LPGDSFARTQAVFLPATGKVVESRLTHLKPFLPSKKEKKKEAKKKRKKLGMGMRMGMRKKKLNSASLAKKTRFSLALTQGLKKLIIGEKMKARAEAIEANTGLQNKGYNMIPRYVKKIGELNYENSELSWATQLAVFSLYSQIIGVTGVTTR
jgi:hypothetical protein